MLGIYLQTLNLIYIFTNSFGFIKLYLFSFTFTAGTPTSAGYLTQGPSTTKMASAPPPVDKEDPLIRPDTLWQTHVEKAMGDISLPTNNKKYLNTVNNPTHSCNDKMCSFYTM